MAEEFNPIGRTWYTWKEKMVPAKDTGMVHVSNGREICPKTQKFPKVTKELK